MTGISAHPTVLILPRSNLSRGRRFPKFIWLLPRKVYRFWKLIQIHPQLFELSRAERNVQCTTTAWRGTWGVYTFSRGDASPLILSFLKYNHLCVFTQSHFDMFNRDRIQKKPRKRTRLISRLFFV